MHTPPLDTIQAELIAEIEELLGKLSDERMRMRLDLDSFLKSVSLLHALAPSR